MDRMNSPVMAVVTACDGNGMSGGGSAEGEGDAGLSRTEHPTSSSFEGYGQTDLKRWLL